MVSDSEREAGSRISSFWVTAALLNRKSQGGLYRTVTVDPIQPLMGQRHQIRSVAFLWRMSESSLVVAESARANPFLYKTDRLMALTKNSRQPEKATYFQIHEALLTRLPDRDQSRTYTARPRAADCLLKKTRRRLIQHPQVQFASALRG